LGLEITAEGKTERCDLWGANPTELRNAERVAGAYEPLCGGRLYLRNRVAGTQTPIERATDLLRDHVPGGDRIVGFVKREFFRDAFLVKEPLVNAVDAGQPSPPTGPLRPIIDSAFLGRAVPSEHMEIELDRPSGPMQLGQWYPAKAAPGIFVSAF